MAVITKSSKAGVDATSAQRGVVITELFAGEDLAKCDACYIASDGKVYKTVLSGSFDGFTNRIVLSGYPVELFGQGVILGYADATMTPGADVYEAADGKVADSGDLVVARAITTSDLLVK